MKRSEINSIIIGSNGYIGRNLSFFLKESNIKNHDFDVTKTSNYSWMKYSKLDITNKKDFNQIDSKVNVIFFLAGITGTDDGFESYENYFNVNVVGLINLLSYIKKHGLKAKIIFPSTRLVYHGVKDMPLIEDSKKTPNTIYALSKFVGENTLDLYSRIFNIDFNIFRICVPYGNLINSDYSYGTIGFFLSKAIQNEKITLYGDGKMKRTFTHIYDICNIIVESVIKPVKSRSIFNIGGDVFSLSNVAQKIAFKFLTEINYVKWPEISRKIESGDTIFNSDKIDKELNNYSYKSFNTWINNIKIRS